MRELRNVVECAVRLAEGDQLHFTSSGPRPRAAEKAPEAASRAERKSRLGRYKELRAEALDRFGREYATALYAESAGRVSRAAKIAGVDPSYLRKCFRDYSLRPDDDDDE